VSTEEGGEDLFRNQIEEVFYSETEGNYFISGTIVGMQGISGRRAVSFNKALQINPNWSEAADDWKDRLS